MNSYVRELWAWWMIDGADVGNEPVFEMTVRSLLPYGEASLKCLFTAGHPSQKMLNIEWSD